MKRINVMLKTCGGLVEPSILNFNQTHFEVVRHTFRRIVRLDRIDDLALCICFIKRKKRECTLCP